MCLGGAPIHLRHVTEEAKFDALQNKVTPNRSIIKACLRRIAVTVVTQNSPIFAQIRLTLPVRFASGV
jgi:hypothetical protein